MNYQWKYDSPIGELILLSDGRNLTELIFPEQRYFDKNAVAGAEEKKLPVFEETCRWLEIYFAGNEPDFMPPIIFKGSEFQVQVWEALRRIPYGQVVTYGELASEIAKARGLAKMSAQAVGGAVGRNPVGIIVPCHRVVGKGGNLTGFGGGIHRKVELLKIEKAYQDYFYIPKKGTAL